MNLTFLAIQRRMGPERLSVLGMVRVDLCCAQVTGVEYATEFDLSFPISIANLRFNLKFRHCCVTRSYKLVVFEILQVVDVSLGMKIMK